MSIAPNQLKNIQTTSVNSGSNNGSSSNGTNGRNNSNSSNSTTNSNSNSNSGSANTTTTVNSERVTMNKSKHRYETSLGQLTKRFFSLLRHSPDGVVNLNEASQALDVQKRRIYDITNVLEGVGLLHKTSKNNIKWSGGCLDSCLVSANNDGTNSRSQLEQEIARLDAKEKALDDAMKLASLELQKATESAVNKPYAYVTYRDLRCIKGFTDQSVIVIKAPSDTKLEVPDPRENLQIWLKSERGEIEVYLCPEDDEKQATAAIISPQATTAGQSGSGSTATDEGKGASLNTELDSQISKSEVKSETEDSSLKYAFISEDDDLAPVNSKKYLLQTEDQTYSFIKMMHNYVNPLSDSTVEQTSYTSHIPSSPLIDCTSSSSINELPFLHLEPPLNDIYSFALDENEGIAELFS